MRRELRLMEVAVFCVSRARFGFLLPMMNYLNVKKGKVTRGDEGKMERRDKKKEKEEE